VTALDDDFAPTEAEIRWLHGENGKPQEKEDSWTPQNLAELADRPPVEPTLGSVGMVYPGKRHVFSGPQESAKTLAAYVIGLSVVRDGSTVVLIDFEMGPWDAKTRLKELGASNDELGRFLYVEPDSPASAEGIGRLAGMEPALVIVDASAGAFQLDSLDDNRRQDVELWSAAWVTPFWRAGIATLVIDHVTKNVEARGNYAIGSERKVGGVDVHLGFTVVRPISRGEHGLYRVTTHKDRGGCLKRGHLCDFKLASDPDTHSITWEFVTSPAVDDEHPFRPTVLMEKVSRYVEQQLGAVSIGDIKSMVTGKAEFVIEATNLLVEEGYVEESEGPRKSRLFVSKRPYRQDSDPFPTHSPAFPEVAHSTRSPFLPPTGGNGSGDELENGNGSQVEDDEGIPF
jgi:hypothetical protein